MDNLAWLIDIIPMPCVLHDKSSILHANAFFDHYFCKEDRLKQPDFYQWLSKTMQNNANLSLLIEAINNHQNISVISEGHVNGASTQWSVHTHSVPFEIFSKGYQITFLQDSSSSYMTKSYWNLHSQVSKARMQLVQEISDRKEAEEKAQNLHIDLLKIKQDLNTASHQAGMAEVAVSVLHNIGNILNSAGVSLSQMKKNMSSNQYSRLEQISQMLKEHELNLIDYFQSDEEGKLLLQYLVTFFEEIQQQHAQFKEELNQFQKHYLLLKDILSAQNEVTKGAAANEKVYLSELIDTSLRLVLTENSLLTNCITINKDYDYNTFIITNRINLMQLLVNLIKNAKDSILEIKGDVPKKINISVMTIEDKDQIEIQVLDTGLGILPENLSKLFRFGFTTKDDGHGFGLHNSSIIAQKLGGSLRAESEGQGLGAKFILTLPISHEAH